MDELSGRNSQDVATIGKWVSALVSDDPQVRIGSRKALVQSNSPAAIAALVGELSDPRDHVRWEAVKALSEIHDPVTAPAFLEALDDENEDVRWVAAEGMAALGRAGLLAMLRALTRKSRSVAFYQGAHHVLHALSNNGYAQFVAPVLSALVESEPAVAVPPIALGALNRLKCGRNE